MNMATWLFVSTQKGTVLHCIQESKLHFYFNF